MSTPTVTCVITNYNQGTFFASAIGSLLKQTIPPDKIIVVDDKSTDDSIKIIENELNNIKVSPCPIEFIKREVNGKLPAARNSAIKTIDTEFISFLDVDDFYYSTKIEKSLSVFIKYPFTSVVYSDYDVWDIRNKTERREFKHPYDARFLMQACIVSTNSMVRKNLFDEIGLYDERFAVAEDYQLWLRALKAQKLFMHIAEPLFCYRLHGGNITLNHADQMQRNIEQYRRELFQ